MKKVITILITSALILSLSVSALADFDLSGLSFEELVALKDQINLAIWNSENWQEVTVPQGVWEVGVDIPAGTWTIRALPDGWTTVIWGNDLEDNGNSVYPEDFRMLYGPENRFYKEGQHTIEWTLILSEGEFVQIADGHSVFTPYAGKPALGFK